MVSLVTGVSGFLGSNLAEALLARGDAVVGVDNLSQGPLANLEGLLGNPRFSFHRADIRDGALMKQLAEDCQCIVHLAGGKIPRYDHALETLDTNALGTQQILAAAVAGRCRVIFASTSDVYGRNPNPPFAESSDLWFGPSTVRRWAYAISKLYGERLGFAYARDHGIPFTAVRFFGGYGPRQDLTWRGGPQSVFIAAALRGDAIPLHGDGTQTRTFTYVSDHVDGILRCIDSPAAAGEVVNLGSTYEISIRDLAELIWKLAGQGELKYELVPYESFGKYEDVRFRFPDIDKARDILDFVPKVTLEEGLRRTIAWQRGIPEGASC